MSNDSMKETLAEEASEEIDFTEIIREGDLGEGVNAKEMGTSIGGWLGKRLGRSFGESVGATVHEVLSGDRDVREAVSNAKNSVTEMVDKQTERGRNLVEGGRQRVQEGEERVESEASKVADELPSTDELSRETLEAMPIEELESVARDVGVKVDVAREEMTTRILETVGGSEDEGGDADDQAENTDSNE